MSKRMQNNFNKRFGNPPRIEIEFETKSLKPTEREYRNKKIVDAYKSLLTGILGREPTYDEFVGNKSILKVKKGEYCYSL